MVRYIEKDAIYVIIKVTKPDTTEIMNSWINTANLSNNSNFVDSNEMYLG